MKRRQLIQAATSVIAAPALASLPMLSFAEDKYPSKPITWICGYAAGGNADLRSRQMAKAMGELMNQAIIVETKAGAGANTGTAAIAHAAPDGYTLGMGNFAPLSVNPAMFAKMPFAPTDITPIMLIERGPLILTVRTESPYKTVKDIVAAAKASPGKLSFANGGIGGSHDLSAALFALEAGIDIIRVNYTGGAPGTTALMGGYVDCMFQEMYAAIPNIGPGGKLRAIAITSPKRATLLPNLPTMAEQGYPEVEVMNWQGVIGPKGMSPALIKYLNEVANKALKDKSIQDIMLKQGNEPVGGTPEQFATFIASQTAKWAKVVKQANIHIA